MAQWLDSAEWQRERTTSPSAEPGWFGFWRQRTSLVSDPAGQLASGVSLFGNPDGSDFDFKFVHPGTQLQ